MHVIETCLKVIIAMFYFCHSKNFSDNMKNIFSFISIYSWKKISLLTSIKQMCYKENNVGLQKLIKCRL